MDNSSSGLADRPTGGGTGLANGPSFRRPPSSRPVSVNPQLDGGGVSSIPTHHIPVITVIVHKDENGYGMKVSGDNPVYVQSVKEGGAAERAGLHSGDKIIKVNGVNVTQSTHTDVVGLIKASTQVVLSVQQRPVTSHWPASTAMTSPSLHARPLHHHHSAPARATDRITSPQPVDHEKLRQFECHKVHTLRLMLEKEQRYVDALRSEIAKSNEPRLLQELTGAERRVRTLQDQLVNLSMQAEHEAVNPQVSALHTHHRTKSSPDPLNMQNMSLAEASKRLIASESMSDLTCGPKRVRGGSSRDVDSPRVTPPGTPPPPYGGNNSATTEGSEAVPHTEEDGHANNEHGAGDAASPEISPQRSSLGSGVQPPIISMEEDEMSDQEVGQLEDHGPFKSLSKLWEHNAHLAVFMNYVISNSDPSSLLFYLVTDLYKEGNAKEMKKWAYEIHSSFLVPGAPLRLNNVDENVAREIDDVLLKDSEKEEFLRRIFFKARLKAKEELNEQLADFQQKRTAGLGTIFGPPEAQLDESIHDKSKEMKIVENILVPKMESYLEDVERDIVDFRRYTTAAALATVMGKVFGLRSPHSSALLDRCPTFVSKDKSLKAKIIGKSRKVTVHGHHFVAHQYYTVTYCNHCQLIIWGIGPQGYQCSDCQLNIHRQCVKVVEESCPGPIVKKEKGNDRISKLMEKIRPEREARRKPSTLNFTHNGGFQILPSMPVFGPLIVDRAKRPSEDDSGGLTDNESGSGDRPVSGGRGGGDRRPDPVRESEERPPQDGLHNEDDDYHHQIAHPVNKKPSAASINRSESYKERVHNKKRELRERRKTSDPNLSKSNDVDVEGQGLSYNTNSGSSSNSSLSTRSWYNEYCRSLDSPSNSLEMVTAARTHEAVTVTLTPNHSTTEWDSDLDAEPDPVDWSRGVDEEVLRQLSPREKKRQEVINELFHTERSHVRNLKVMDQVFFRPMLESQILPHDHVQLLFSNLDEMLDIHSQFNNGMKAKRRENPLVGDISDLLLAMFDGPAGENFQRAASTFCARQQIALELLKERRRKDTKLNNFLTDAEGNSMCRRLQLKDILPTAMQRLTKYPLLFENLAKYTEEETEELANLQRAVERSKEILNQVNQAVKEAEDNQRLTDIQRRLDKSGFEKVEHPMAGEFKHLDLTKHRLIYEGSLNWRIGNRQKLIDLHVLLLDDVIILLQKQDEKYVLKFYNINTAGGGGERSPTLSPIIKVSTVLVRPNAVDKKALYLVNTSHNGAQIYDLVATSSSERKTWFRHISEAAEAYKTRDGKNRRPESSGPSLPLSTPDNEAPENPPDKTKDSEETASEPAKEPSDLLVPPGGSSHDVDTTPSPNENTPLPSSESTSTTPQASPSSAPADGGEPLAKKMEQLRRKDEAIRTALAEKQQLVADILHVPREDFENIAELAGEPSLDKEATELVLAAVNQANQLTAVLNDSLRVTEEEAVCATSEVVPGSSPRVGRKVERLPGVPAHRLQSISNSLNAQLTQLLKIIKDRDEERERLRRELQRSREQLHVMHESHRRSQLNASASPSHSRPNSLISQEGSCEPHHESEDDTGLHRSALTGENDDEVIDVSELGTDKHSPTEQHDDTGPDVFVDALSGESEGHPESEPETSTKANEGSEETDAGGESLAEDKKVDI